jgi:glucose/mannose-6-phosphate isomerase
VQAVTQLLSEQAAAIHQQARQLAEALDGTVPQLLATTGNVALATRWRQQLNENAKMLAWEAEVPEMNHNELVGWEGGDERFSVVFLRHEHDLARNQKRLAIIEEIIRGKTQQVHTVWSRGANPVERHLYLIHLGDWLSYYLAEKRGVDIIDIRSIDRLKSELGKIPF